MRILAVITEPEQVRKILRHLVKIGRGGAPVRRPAARRRGLIHLRLTDYLSPSSPSSRLRGISVSPRRSLGFQRAVFLALSTRRSSREVRLSRDLVYATEDERKSLLDRPVAANFGDLPDQLGF